MLLWRRQQGCWRGLFVGEAWPQLNSQRHQASCVPSFSPPHLGPLEVRWAHHAAPPHRPRLLGQMSSFMRGQPHHVGPLGKPRKRKQASHFGVRWPMWPREPTPSCLSPRTAPLVGFQEGSGPEHWLLLHHLLGKSCTPDLASGALDHLAIPQHPAKAIAVFSYCHCHGDLLSHP